MVPPLIWISDLSVWKEDHHNWNELSIMYLPCRILPNTRLDIVRNISYKYITSQLLICLFLLFGEHLSEFLILVSNVQWPCPQLLSLFESRNFSCWSLGWFFFFFFQLTFFYICKSGTHFQWINVEWWSLVALYLWGINQLGLILSFLFLPKNFRIIFPLFQAL
jgi:hypothetical protein